MNGHRIWKNLCLVASFLTLSAYSAGATTQVPAAKSSARSAVSGFYRLHFSNQKRMFFSRENVRRVRGRLSPRLYRLMLYEFQRADEMEQKYRGEDARKPYFSGDVFTDSESPPQVFRIGDSTQRGKTAEVTVWCHWNDNVVGKMKRRIVVVLVLHQNTWLIDDLKYENGSGLVSELSRKDYFQK